jgi:hypothetical protein
MALLCRVLLPLALLALLPASTSGASRAAEPLTLVASDAPAISRWPRGGSRPCGTLRTPGASYGGRGDETDHCFPASASDHYVCCVAIQSVDNALNADDAGVARHNPLAGPIRRNSDASSYSWCVCSVSICTHQLNGTVAWVGTPGDT